MIFKRIEPSHSLKYWVKEYWIIENEDPAIIRQKIIPDGYFEIIFHYRDPYKINIQGRWEIQPRALFAGQIRKHFYLENTGKSGMIGIKLHPATPNALFNHKMTDFVDKVVDLAKITEDMNGIVELDSEIELRISQIELWLQNKIPTQKITMHHTIRSALDKILQSNGMISIGRLAEELKISRRHFERKFKEIVGLSPKFYSRIIRFSYIFKLLNKENESWSQLALNSGHFDQSHFIKNFKEFTGEEPGKYGFDEKNMANFFLQNR